MPGSSSVSVGAVSRQHLWLKLYTEVPQVRICAGGGGLPPFLPRSVDQRADRIFGEAKSKRILKVLPHFSHANNIERLAGNSELICAIEELVNELIAALEEHDRLHMEA